MGHITIDMKIHAPVAAVFAYVDDYRNTTKYMKDLVKWQPTGKVTHGEGAQFDVGMKAGPTTLTSVVHITAWAENRTIGWKSVDGFKQTGKWAFSEKGDRTQVVLDMDYEFGGGIAGKLLGRAADPIVRGNLQQSVETLRRHTERLTTPRSTPKAAPKNTTKPATKHVKPVARSSTKPATKAALQSRSKAKNT